MDVLVEGVACRRRKFSHSLETKESQARCRPQDLRIPDNWMPLPHLKQLPHRIRNQRLPIPVLLDAWLYSH